MTFLRSLPFALALALAPTPLLAQALTQPVAPSDADALADQVRRLSANPQDLDALLAASTLSIRLGDLSAAAAFLTRAEKLAPADARIKAGEGSMLVRSERPGEALRLFAQAEGMGLPIARFAADRGLAYDLVGDQPRAQRDYRAALAAQADDETTRRYALSLGISGKQQLALDQLAPLVRQDDRGAWRARAFILAMGGDTAQASQIAATMMPPGSAQGLKAFFAQLPTLPAINRAFAVHFGEVHASAARLADARLAPALAPLPAEPAPVQVAMLKAGMTNDKGVGDRKAGDKGRRHKDKKGQVAIASALPPAPVEAALQPPAYRAPAYQVPAYQPPIGSGTGSPVDRPLTAGERASLAAAGLRTSPAHRNGQVVPPYVVPATPAGALSPAEQASLAAATSGDRPSRRRRGRPDVASAAPAVPAAIVAATPRPDPATIAAVTPRPIASSLATPVVPPSASVTPPTALPPVPITVSPPTASNAPVTLASALPPSTVMPLAASSISPSGNAPAIVATSEAATSPPVPSSPLAAPIATAPVEIARTMPRPRRRAHAEADDILARIVAGLTVPAAELGVEKAQPASVGRTARHAAAPLTAAADTPAPSPADRRAAARKAAADKKAAAEKKALADEAAAVKKAERAEPARIWVQVAGGANPKDLAKAWSGAKGKAPDAFAGHKGWTTPLRATNRVLTGPFKTDADARAYVNQLAKSGVSAFTFTSDPGQKVSRLESK